ncbi:heme A synthase [Hamadaea flava]|uniref:Uncharacterized protein n=1 Tax=Hamadaea flava TaxID=1742688 RepID=A0ABV8LXC9_9ACTN|nr:hypothetical protein [Hamadaea flava]MCP2327000.1 heme A synthase [Hamadaea flava]
MSLTPPAGSALPAAPDRSATIPGYLALVAMYTAYCLRPRRRPAVVTIIVVVLVFVTLLVTAGVSPYAAVAVTLAGGLAAVRIHQRANS